MNDAPFIINNNKLNNNILTMSKQQLFSVGLTLCALTANAAIVNNGPWTGNDWYDDVTKIGVANGVPYSNDARVQRRITAPLTIDGSIDSTYLTMPNVMRV